MGGVTTSEDATGSSRVCYGCLIAMEKQLGNSDKLVIETGVAVNDRMEGRQTVTRILQANSDIKFDSVCLSHDMHVTHSHEVYRQWVSAG